MCMYATAFSKSSPTRIRASFSAFSFLFRIATRFAAAVTALSLRSEPCTTAGAPSTAALSRLAIRALSLSLAASCPAVVFPSLELLLSAGGDDSLIPRMYADNFRLGWALSLQAAGLVVGRPSLPVVPAPPPPAALGFAAFPAECPSGVRFAVLSSADLRRLFSALLRNISLLRARTCITTPGSVSSVFAGDGRQSFYR